MPGCLLAELELILDTLGAEVVWDKLALVGAGLGDDLSQALVERFSVLVIK